MKPAIVDGNLLKLPENIARRLRGRRVQIMETKEGILLKPTGDVIAEARGFLKGRGFTTRDYVEQKRADKELEE